MGLGWFRPGHGLFHCFHCQNMAALNSEGKRFICQLYIFFFLLSAYHCEAGRQTRSGVQTLLGGR